jgi:hypothetical protein
MYYDPRSKTPVAFRRSIDDDPDDPDDDKAFPLGGPGGVAELVAKFRHNGLPTTDPAYETPWPLTEAEMLHLQRQDPRFQPILTALTDKISGIEYTPTKTLYQPQANDGGQDRALRLMNNTGTAHHTDVIVLPACLTTRAIQFYHDQLAHPGRLRTIATLQLAYWWPGLATEVADYVSSCQFCNLHKHNRGQAKVPIQMPAIPGLPFEIAHMDLTAQALPETQSGNKYILAVKDKLTRYVELFALKNKNPLTVARALLQVFIRHGAIRHLVSDQGGEFLNKTIEQFSALLTIKRFTTTPYVPRANGQVENHNLTLKDQLSAYCNAFQDNWDDHLGLCQFTYNTTVNSQTNLSPFFMLHGREASQPHNMWVTDYLAATPDLHQYVQSVAERLAWLWGYAAQRKPAETELHNRTPARSRVFKEYVAGDYFFLKNIPDATFTHWTDPKTKRPISGKLQHRWVGPYCILEKHNPVLYTADILGVPTLVHALLMKHLKTPQEYILRSALHLQPQPSATEVASARTEQHIE